MTEAMSQQPEPAASQDGCLETRTREADAEPGAPSNGRATVRTTASETPADRSPGGRGRLAVAQAARRASVPDPGVAAPAPLGSAVGTGGRGRSARPAARVPYLAPVPDSLPPFDQDRTPVNRVRELADRRRALAGAAARAAATKAAAARSAAARSAMGRAVADPAAPSGTPTGAAPHTVSDAAVPTWSREADVGIRRTSSLSLPPADRTGQVLARALIEVLSGRRPLAQLRVHCAPDVFAGLQVRALLPGQAARLSSVRVCEPADGVAEISAVFRIGGRARALAFRIQGLDGRWRITALQTG